MHKTKKIILFISVLILLFSLESILLNFTIEFEPTSQQQIEIGLPEEEPVAKPATFEMKKGILFKIFL